MYPYTSFPQTIHWNKADNFSWDVLPARVRRWLFSTASTSALIQKGCEQTPIIDIVRHGWQYPHISECLVLGMKRNTYAWVREIRMLGADKPWMLARVIFPRATLRHAGHPNITGTAPIGHALFNDNRTSRSTFEIAQLYGKHPPLSHALKWESSVWGRRSVFFIDDWPILLSEVFLPIFQKYLESKHESHS